MWPALGTKVRAHSSNVLLQHTDTHAADIQNCHTIKKERRHSWILIQIQLLMKDTEDSKLSALVQIQLQDVDIAAAPE